MKSLFEKIPSHYWTGILGGVIYFAWIGVAALLWSQWHLIEPNFFSYIVFYVILAPVFFSFAIGNFLIALASSFFEDIPFGVQAILVIIAIILPGLLFVGVGVVLGKKSKDLKREKLKRRIFLILFMVVAIVCVCYAFFITVAGYLTRT